VRRLIFNMSGWAQGTRDRPNPAEKRLGKRICKGDEHEHQINRDGWRGGGRLGVGQDGKTDKQRESDIVR